MLIFEALDMIPKYSHMKTIFLTIFLKNPFFSALFIFITLSAHMFQSLASEPAQTPPGRTFTLTNKHFCDYFFERLPEALIGSEDPVTKLIKLFGDRVNGKEIPKGIYELESEIFDLLNKPLADRDTKAFVRKWGFSESRTFDLLTYYGFVMVVKTSSDPQVILHRLREISLDFFLRSDAPAARRYEYYRTRVGLLSVPEMAEEIRRTQEVEISELQIYKELSTLGISIVDRYARNLTDLQKLKIIDKLESLQRNDLSQFVQTNSNLLTIMDELIDGGLSEEQTAQACEVSLQAMRFIRHHVSQKSRGVKWDRLVNFEDSYLSEEEVLITLTHRGQSELEIASFLNDHFHTQSIEPGYRTEKSIHDKKEEMGLTTPRGVIGTSLYDPQYGFLKNQRGELQTLPVFTFFLDHRGEEICFFADYLGVEEETFIKFLQRNGIIHKPEGQRWALSDQTENDEAGPSSTQPLQVAQEVIRRAFLQRQSIDTVIDWIKCHNNIPPRGIDFAASGGSDKVAIHLDKLMGVGSYNIGRPSYHYRIFSSPEEFWTALYLETKKRGFPINLFEIKLNFCSSKFIELRRECAFRLIMDWIITNRGKLPSHLDFGWDGNKIRASYNIVMAQGHYAKDKINGKLALFQSSQKFWIWFYQESKKRNIFVNLLGFILEGELEPELRTILQNTVIQLVLDWIKENPDKKLNYKIIEKITQSDNTRIFGLVAYRNSPLSIFSCPSEFWTKLYHAQKSANVSFRLLALSDYLEVSEDIRKILKAEIIDLSLDWIKANDFKTPTKKDFKNRGLTVGYNRAFGGSGNSIYASLLEYRCDLKKAIEDIKDTSPEWKEGKEKALQHLKRLEAFTNTQSNQEPEAPPTSPDEVDPN